MNHSLEPCSVCGSTDNVAYQPHLLTIAIMSYCGECRWRRTESAADFTAYLERVGEPEASTFDLTVFENGQRVSFAEWYQQFAQEPNNA